jgi:O-antigen/teichoic acid export membrane protein
LVSAAGIVKMLRKLQNLKNHQSITRYFKNTSWLFGEKILRMTVGLFVGVWVARYLGPEQFGIFAYAQSLVGLFAIIATLGLDSIVVRELVKGESRRDELIGTTFWLKMMGAIGVLIMIAVSVGFTSIDQDINILVFIIALATIFHSFNVIDFYFQSKVLSKYVVHANIISLFISSIVKIALILNEAPLIAFAWVVLFDSFVVVLGLVYFYRKNNQKMFSQIYKFNKHLALDLLKDSWPLIISGMTIIIYARIDQVMLFEMVDANEVGQYSVAIRLVEILDFWAIIVVKSLAPSITSAKEVSDAVYYHRLEVLYKFMMISFLAFFIPILLFGEQIILLLYGEQYTIAASLFVLAAFRTLFTNYGTARTLFITNENLFKQSMYFTIIGSILNVLLNLLLIPIYKSLGAIIATIISLAITIFILNSFFDKFRMNGILMAKSLYNFYTLKIKDAR